MRNLSSVYGLKKMPLEEIIMKVALCLKIPKFSERFLLLLKPYCNAPVICNHFPPKAGDSWAKVP